MIPLLYAEGAQMEEYDNSALPNKETPSKMVNQASSGILQEMLLKIKTVLTATTLHCMMFNFVR